MLAENKERKRTVVRGCGCRTKEEEKKNRWRTMLGPAHRHTYHNEDQIAQTVPVAGM